MGLITSSNNNALLKHQDIYDLRKQIESLDAPCFDSEVYSKGLDIAAFYVRNGYVKFLDFSHKLLKDVGNCIKPYLKSLYSGIRYCPGMETVAKDMSSLEFVDRIDLESVKPDDKFYRYICWYAIGLWYACECLEKGYYSIDSLTRVMIQDMGETIRPEIIKCYEGARDWYKYHKIDEIVEKMDPYDEVKEFDSEFFDKPFSLRDQYYAPKNPGFLTITRHPGVLESHDILENLVLMDIMSSQLEKDGEVDARGALKQREELSNQDLYEWANREYNYFYDPEWNHVWVSYRLDPETALSHGEEVPLFPIEEALADIYSNEGKLPTKEEAEDVMIELLEDSFLQKFWEPTPEWDHTGPERMDEKQDIDLTPAENHQEPEQSKNFLRNKYKSYEEGLAEYLEWKESFLEPYEKPADEIDISSWTASFKALWEREELKEVWD